MKQLQPCVLLAPLLPAPSAVRLVDCTFRGVSIPTFQGNVTITGVFQGGIRINVGKS